MNSHREAPDLRWKAFALIGPALLAAAVALWSITARSLWRDESVTAHFVRVPLSEAWREWGEYDAVHATHYLLVRLTAWIEPIELGLRLPSVIAFMITVVGIVLVGRRLSGWLVGTCAATVYVLMPIASRYAQEGRSYEMVSAAAVFSTLALLRLVERPSWGRAAAYGALIVLLGFLHLYGLLLLVAHGLHVVLRGRNALIRCCVAWTAAGLLLLPLALIAAGQRERQLSWLIAPGWTEFENLIQVFTGSPDLTVVLGLTAAAGIWFARREPLVLMWATLPIAASFAISQFHEVFTDRYVLFVVPAFALLVGSGLIGVGGLIARRWPLLGAATVAGLLTLVAVLGLPVQRENRGPAQIDDLRSMTRYLAAESRPTDVLVPAPLNFTPFVNVYGGPFERLDIVTPAAITEDVDRVWAINRNDPRALGWQELRDLSNAFDMVSVKPFGVVHLSLWTRR